MKKILIALCALLFTVSAGAQDGTDDPGAALQALITQAEAIDATKLNTRGAADLAAAIAAAQAATSDYDAATAALQTAITTANAIIPAYAKYKELKTYYEGVASEEGSVVMGAGSSIRTDFATAISTAQTAVEAAPTAAGISAPTATMTAAYQTYAVAAYPAQGKTFDMTFMMVNPEIISIRGWIDSVIGSDKPYRNAPDPYYLYAFASSKKDMRQELDNLPDGNYSVKVATKGYKSSQYTQIKEDYVYAQSHLKRNQVDIVFTPGEENDGELGYGWNWSNIPAVPVTDGYLKIGFMSDNGKVDSSADDFRLYRAYDTSELGQVLNDLIAEATTLNVEPIPNALSAALSDAVNCGNPFLFSEFVAAINSLKAAVSDAKAWKAAYAKHNELETYYEEVAREEYSIVDDMATRTTFQNAISTAHAAVGAAATAAAITAATATMNAAYQAYAVAAYPAQDKSFDMTFMMANPQVASATGWTDGTICTDHPYRNAPDSVYLYSANWQNIDMRQELDSLPDGNYSVKVATMATKAFASAQINDNFVYAQSHLKRNQVDITATLGKDTDGELGYGWSWSDIPAVPVADGYLKIGFMSANGRDVESGVDDFRLYRTYDTSEFSQSLSELIAEATALNVEPISDARRAALNDAINCGQPAKVSEFTAAINTLQAAISDAKAWKAAYAKYEEQETYYEGVAGEEGSIVNDPDTRATFQTAISTARTAVEAAATAGDITAATAILTAAYQVYAVAAYPAQGKTFDMTFMMANPQVASATGWTDGIIGTDKPYENAPDGSYLCVPKYHKEDMRQELTSLPEGNYSVKVATMARKDAADSEVKDIYVYAQSNLGRNQVDIEVTFGKYADGELHYGWNWTDIPAVPVADGYLKTGLMSDNRGQVVSGADDFHLYRAFDTSEFKAELDAIVAEANTLNVAPISDEHLAALNQAINCGNPFTISEYISAINSLKTAVGDTKAWKAAYGEAKASLTAALERADEYVNDDNTAKHAMCPGTWQPLQAAVIAARAAAALTDSYDNFVALADALTAALAPADRSIALWSRYTALKDGLNALHNSILDGVADNYSTDDDVEATTAAMAGAADTWLTTQARTVDVSPLLGGNTDFEAAAGALSHEGSNVYDVVGWSNTFTTDAQPQEACRERLAADSGAPDSDNMLRMRANSADTKMQISKDVWLPKGFYRLKVWIRKAHIQTSPTELNYIEENGNRHDIGGSDEWSRQTVRFCLAQTSLINLSLGFINGAAGGETEMLYDDITLTYGNFYQEALDAATNAYNNDPAKLALKSALDEFTYTTDEEDAKTEAELNLAADVLRKAIAIQAADGEATTLWNNHDFLGAATGYPLQDGCTGNVQGPDGWTLEYDLGGNNACYVKDGFFKFWANDIRHGNLHQTVDCLPNGTYKISADIMTSKKDGSSWIALYGDPGDPAAVGRTANVYSSDSKAYSNRSVYVDVADHSLKAGIRTDNGYFQVTNIKVEFVAPNATETANGRLYQQAFLDRDADIADFTGIEGASNCEVYLNNKNAIIKANEGAVSNTGNVVVGGRCDNLVLTDGKPFTPTEAFTAGQVTYTRDVVAGDGEWNTFYAPFACELPDGITAYEYRGMSGDNAMSVAPVERLEACKAYLMQNANAEASTTFTATEAAISAFAEPVADGLFGSTAIYNVGEATDIYMLAADNMWHPATAGSKSKPFRACFKAPAAGGSLRIVVGGQTGIRETAGQARTGKPTIHNLAGQAVGRDAKSLKPGVYVVDGKKVIIK